VNRSVSFAMFVLGTCTATMANQPRRVCPTCKGARSTTDTVRRRETCGRCGGRAGKKSGKVWVPCSGCGGKGGWDRTSRIQVTCRTCGGTGFR